MHCLGDQIESFCSQWSITRRIVCRSTHINTVLQLVDLGLGVSLVPEMCAACDTSGTREYRRFKRGGPKREIAVAIGKDRQPSRIATNFIRLVQANIESGKLLYKF